MITRSGPNRSSARSASASTSSARGDPLWVTTIWSNTGSSAARMPSTSLSAITETTPTRNRKSNSSCQRLRQRGGAGRVVRGIDENRWRAAHPLQPARAGDGGEPGPHRVDVELTLRAGAEERLDRGQRDDRVVRLMLAVQRKEDVGVHPAEALQLQQLPADGDLAAEHRELRILAGDRGVGAHRLRQQHLHRLGQLAGDHRDGVGRHQVVGLPGDDARLLAGDLGDGVAEVVDVVDADRA